ncbi:hypothetical protein [Erwinia phage Zoomie]|uniref:Uncharacterized protein n=1 Tax=Erwinia phage Zoomie TaxID=2851072 RepID=A0A9E6T395_9CAUD|nr:hypothetical protein [Erwinia phage Zoomie]
MSFQTMMLDSSELTPYIEQFHIYGHGIANGVEEHEHLRRILQEAEGLIGMLVLKELEPVALITLMPGLVEDSHFNGVGLCCVHFAGSGLGLAGMRCVHRSLRELAKQNGAAWYSISSRVSTYEYRNRYYMMEKPL